MSQKHYGAFYNFEGWEVWLFDGTTRIDKAASGFRSYQAANRRAERYNRELAIQGKACYN